MSHPTFRLLLIIGTALVIPIMVYHRLRAGATRERLDRRREGLFILLTLRPIGLAGMLGLMAFMINPAWMAWASVPLPAGLRWVGIGLGVIGGVMIIWTLRTLGKNLTDTVVTREAHTLVTRGPYRWVRHPFYISVGLIVLANALATANGFIFACGMIVMMLLVKRTRIEEENLLSRFGEEYRQYMQRTGRFIPGFK